MDIDAVVHDLLERCRADHQAWINGDGTPYALPDDGTVLGAVGGFSVVGAETADRQRRVASQWRCGTGSIEFLNGGVDGDLAWLAFIERSRVEFANDDDGVEHRWDLRVTEVFVGQMGCGSGCTGTLIQSSIAVQSTRCGGTTRLIPSDWCPGTPVRCRSSARSGEPSAVGFDCGQGARPWSIRQMADVLAFWSVDGGSMIDREPRVRFSRLLVDEMSDDDGVGFALPTGTVTFLLTDVEGSSQRWELAPDGMALAIPRHYQILDEAIAGRGGVRPVEQGEGDSVVAAFARASDALAAAVDAQRMLLAERWPVGADLRVRMAVHTGEAQQRDEGNYFGQTVIRCARLRAIGHGGQILVSDAAAALTVDQLPAGVYLTDLGVHRLKDLGRPERVWQVVHAELPAAHAPLRSLDVHRHNLPVQITPLFGRDRDVAELARLVDTERMVTLTGAGGVGKTRLALATAADAMERFTGGVWFVELAGVADESGVVPAVLAATGAHAPGGLSGVDQLLATLTPEPTLVVLDNCEHLVECCAELAAELVSRHPGVTVLATSRERLGVHGEVVWHVASLSAPPDRGAVAVATLSQFDAVRLFIDRARRARPSFELTDANAAAVAQICYRLDGIPLAIELAAARCRQMSVQTISTDVDDRFHLLTGGARTVLPRQQTLAASVDWSYDRLDATEQQVFRRLGVFAGPFPLEAAEAVAGGSSQVDRVVVFDAISRLVDKSLVQLEDHPDGDQHYRLLETLRAYAIERLDEAGELDAAKDAHVTYWLDWLEQREPTLHTDGVIQQLERVHDTVAAALDWSTHDPVRGLPLLRYLARVWQGSGRPQSVLNAVDLLLTEANAELHPVPWAAAAVSAAVPVMTARGGSEASSLIMRARAVALEADDDYFAAVADMLLGFADEHCERVKRLARERGQRYVECIATIAQAAGAVESDPTVASAMLADADIVAAARESRYLRDFSNRTAARAALYLGDLGDCAERARELATSPSLLMAESATRLLATVGLLTRDESLADLAVELARTRLAHVPGTRPSADAVVQQRALLDGGATQLGPEIEPENIDPYDPLSGYILSLLCREAIDAGRAEVAVAAVRAHPLDTPLHRTIRTAIEAAATHDEALWHDAVTLAGEHGLRVIVADALEGIASTAADAEAWSECLHLAASAQRLRTETGYLWRFPFEQQRLDAARKAATEALGGAAAATATKEGATIEWRDAIAYTNRARGERKRPSHGWAALTPTELQVVALAAQGLTNPQIAERLLMGRATVKTHLEHAFTKTGVHTRTELAAEYARRNPTN